MAPEVIKGDPYTERADIWYTFNLHDGAFVF